MILTIPYSHYYWVGGPPKRWLLQLFFFGCFWVWGSLGELLQKGDLGLEGVSISRNCRLVDWFKFQWIRA